MPSNRSLKTRLTFLNTAVLLLILGSGGFFLYSSQQQQLVNQIDAELQAIAIDVSRLQQGSKPANSQLATFCQPFKQLTQHHADKVSATLFDSQGKLLCSNNARLTDLLRFSTSGAAGEAYNYYSINTTDGKQFRQLVFPLRSTDGEQIQLQLGISLQNEYGSAQISALTITIFSALAAICFALCHWLLLGLLTNPLAQLSRLMEQTNEENIPQPFQTSKSCGKELQQLAENYNTLTEQLALSLRKAQQFSADVTHELRTPLTILRGETELALRGDKDKQQLQQILCSNQEEISRMGHLIDDLLLLSKSELGEVPLKMEAIDLSGLLDELHFQAKIIAESKQIQVNMQAAELPISLLADTNRLRQVFLNLLSNAIKYTPEGGTVTIHWSLQKNFARIIIEDTGIGIDNKHQEHIFDRFFRIDKTSNRHDGGSGLGLAIAKWIVDAHHGSIRVCSAPGQGSCFTVMLPLTHRQNHAQKDKTNC